MEIYFNADSLLKRRNKMFNKIHIIKMENFILLTSCSFNSQKLGKGAFYLHLLLWEKLPHNPILGQMRRTQSDTIAYCWLDKKSLDSFLQYCLYTVPNTYLLPERNIRCFFSSGLLLINIDQIKKLEVYLLQRKRELYDFCNKTNCILFYYLCHFSLDPAA